MTPNHPADDIIQVLQRFQDGYTARDVAALDSFMQLFVEGDDVELIGIGAFARGGPEWFQGTEAVREIIESDWTYWGDVRLDIEGAKVTVQGDVAWLSTCGVLIQTGTFDEALPLYLKQMQEMLQEPAKDPDAKLMEATHFGMRRLRERGLGDGHRWPFVFTAVLVRSSGTWRFHTIHWSMPVD